MYVFNVTTKIDPSILEEWLGWQKEQHIPEMMATQLFDDYKIYHLLELDEEDGITFTVQFFTTSMERYLNYINQHAPKLREKAFAKWGNRFASFRTIMKAVQ